MQDHPLAKEERQTSGDKVGLLEEKLDEYCLSARPASVREACALIEELGGTPARIRISELGVHDVIVELRGELDISTVGVLRSSIEKALASGELVFVELSKITFLDTTCLRELIDLRRLHANHLTFVAPSWQVKVSVEACGMDEHIRFAR